MWFLKQLVPIVCTLSHSHTFTLFMFENKIKIQKLKKEREKKIKKNRREKRFGNVSVEKKERRKASIINRFADREWGKGK